MTHLSPFLQNNPSHRLQGGWLQLDPSFSDKSGQVAQVDVVFQWAQLLLDFFFSRNIGEDISYEHAGSLNS